MTRAYDERYLDDGMNNLGEAVDYAVNACGMEMDTFFKLFVSTGYADQFGAGTPKIIAGLSGTELVWEVVKKAGEVYSLPEPQTVYDCSAQYWCGWSLAYYQWFTGRPFRDILQNISAAELEKLYPTLHEASEEKFVDTVNSIIRRKNLPTRLQTLRKQYGYSQRGLAERSGVSLRMIQQYELRAKDINKAAGGTLLALSKALGCRMEDLFEYDASEITDE